MCFSGMRVVARGDLAGCRCAQVGPIGAYHPNAPSQCHYRNELPWGACPRTWSRRGRPT